MSLNDLARGTLLGGKYKVEGILGQGGMGSVYQAVNSTIGRTVAIKLLDAKLADNADFIHRFQMEAKAAALIGHPGIVDVLDMGETDEGMPFIVMEYLEGVTLKALLKKSGALSAPLACGVMIPVLDALVAAHAAGVIHRDLKPANIFVCLKPTPSVKILDFGISKFSSGGSGITQTGTSMGTPAYMSPEQVRGEKQIGPQSDLYSIGAILYNLVSGHPPFEGESDLAVVARVLTDFHRPLATVRPDLPQKLSVICDRLLTKAADQRPADAAQVKRALEAVAKPDYDALWKAAKTTFESDTSTGLKALKEQPTTPTTPTGGRSSRTKGSRPSMARPPRASPARETRAAAPEPVEVEAPPAAEEPIVLPPSNTGRTVGLVLGAVALIGVGGLVTWKVLQPAPVVPPVAVVEVPIEKPKPPEATPPPPVEAAKPVVLKVSADPAEARFTLDGEAKDCNPCTFEGAAGKKGQLVASAAGHVTKTMELVFDASRELSVALAPEAKVVAADPGQKGSKTKGSKPGKPDKPDKKNLILDEQNPYE